MPRIVCGFVWVLLVVVSGCASKDPDLPETIPLKGRVLLKGEPVKFGAVVFLSQSGHVGFGNIQPDGSFQVTTFRDDDGVVLGTHKVAVIAVDYNQPPPEPPAKLAESGVPERYTRFETTPLRAEVTREIKQIEFDLE